MHNDPYIHSMVCPVCMPLFLELFVLSVVRVLLLASGFRFNLLWFKHLLLCYYLVGVYVICCFFLFTRFSRFQIVDVVIVFFFSCCALLHLLWYCMHYDCKMHSNKIHTEYICICNFKVTWCACFSLSF